MIENVFITIIDHKTKRVIELNSNVDVFYINEWKHCFVSIDLPELDLYYIYDKVPMFEIFNCSHLPEYVIYIDTTKRDFFYMRGFLEWECLFTSDDRYNRLHNILNNSIDYQVVCIDN